MLDKLAATNLRIINYILFNMFKLIKNITTNNDILIIELKTNSNPFRRKIKQLIFTFCYQTIPY